MLLEAVAVLGTYAETVVTFFTDGYFALKAGPAFGAFARVICDSRLLTVWVI